MRSSEGWACGGISGSNGRNYSQARDLGPSRRSVSCITRIFAADVSGVYQRRLIGRESCPVWVAKENCYNNASVERFFSSLKNELFHYKRFGNSAKAHREIFDFIKLFYCPRRLRLSLGCRSPAEFDRSNSAPSSPTHFLGTTPF